MMTSSDYLTVFENCALTTKASCISELDRAAKTIMAHKEIYQDVERVTRVPWFVVAAIHSRESGNDFTRHLHNGDTLTMRTTHVPAGRPATGEPPFAWVASAIDALGDAWRPIDWFMSTALEFCETYNGPGYSKRGIPSPYVWAYTSAYASGLYVADGKFDPTAVSRQPGCAAIFKTLLSKGVTLDFPSQAATLS